MQVAQLSYERTLGTMTGGLLGFLVRVPGQALLAGHQRRRQQQQQQQEGAQQHAFLHTSCRQRQHPCPQERNASSHAPCTCTLQVYDYGVLMLPPVAAQVLMVAAAAAVGAVSCWLSNRYKLDASMRLFVITFLIVSCAGHAARSPRPPLQCLSAGEQLSAACVNCWPSSCTTSSQCCQLRI